MNDTKPPPARPLCFVLMPFGQKPDPRGGPPIDFDAIYERGLKLAIKDAGLEPIRADAERTGGIVHKAMFERLLLCEFAVADLTTGSANVFYELGVRHAVRQRTTLPVFAQGHLPPFDLNLVRCLPYRLGKHNAFGDEEAAAFRNAVGERLTTLKGEHFAASTDSPVFQLVDTLEPPDIDRLRTDTFRDQLRYEKKAKAALRAARATGDPAQLQRFENSLGESLLDEELDVLVDLFISYRALDAWQPMVDLHERLPEVLKRTRMIAEQLGFALNRLGQREAAEAVLERVVSDYGRSSETNGLLGRIHKDRWQEAHAAGRELEARGHLKRAIAAYTAGFEADLRDAYPGVNAVTLLELEGSEPSLREQHRMLPVVRFAAEQRLKAAEDTDYWAHATLVELAVLARDPEGAATHLGDALAAVRESWEPETTANNLRMIRDARGGTENAEAWLDEIIEAIERYVRE